MWAIQSGGASGTLAMEATRPPVSDTAVRRPCPTPARRPPRAPFTWAKSRPLALSLAPFPLAPASPRRSRAAAPPWRPWPELYELRPPAASDPSLHATPVITPARPSPTEPPHPRPPPPLLVPSPRAAAACHRAPTRLAVGDSLRVNPTPPDRLRHVRHFPTQHTRIPASPLPSPTAGIKPRRRRTDTPPPPRFTDNSGPVRAPPVTRSWVKQSPRPGAPPAASAASSRGLGTPAQVPERAAARAAPPGER